MEKPWYKNNIAHFCFNVTWHETDQMETCYKKTKKKFIKTETKTHVIIGYFKIKKYNDKGFQISASCESTYNNFSIDIAKGTLDVMRKRFSKYLKMLSNTDDY